MAEPDVLILFEDRRDALEMETRDLLRVQPDAGPDQLAKALGMSPAGAQFLLTKMKMAERS